MEASSMSDAVFIYRPDDGPEFQWHGGEYIDIGYTAEVDTGPFNNLGQPSHYAGEFVAHEVINVWDSAKDEPRIPRTLEAFQARCDEWLEGRDES
jgi:hypothetical protein